MDINEHLSSLMYTGVTAIVAYVGTSLRSYIESKKSKEVKVLETRETEKAVCDSVDYVKDVFIGDYKPEVESKTPKIDEALKYIKDVEPDVYARVGVTKLRYMIRRMVQQQKKDLS